MWKSVEFELPEDGEVVEVRIGRYHVTEMAFYGENIWRPMGKNIHSTGNYPHKIEYWRRKEDNDNAR